MKSGTWQRSVLGFSANSWCSLKIDHTMNGHEHCIEQQREKNCIFTKHLHMQSISPAHDYYYRHEIGIWFSYLDKFKCWTTEELDQRKLKLSNLFRKIPFRLRIDFRTIYFKNKLFWNSRRNIIFRFRLLITAQMFI